jgi:small nuclear ribonucleoprotein (snRNP)-like protein
MSSTAAEAPKKAPPRKESILELQKLMDAVVRVKCLGGREMQGTLRGYDDLVNLVLEDTDEFLRGKAIFVFSSFSLIDSFVQLAVGCCCRAKE